jgi:hypothetical protein
VVKIKCIACDILLQISQLEVDTKGQVFISKIFADVEANAADNDLYQANSELLDVICESKGFENIS